MLYIDFSHSVIRFFCTQMRLYRSRTCAPNSVTNSSRPAMKHLDVISCYKYSANNNNWALYCMRILAYFWCAYMVNSITYRNGSPICWDIKINGNILRNRNIKNTKTVFFRGKKIKRNIRFLPGYCVIILFYSKDFS